MKAIPLVISVEDLEARTTTQTAFLRSPVRLGRGELNDLRLDRLYVSTWHGVVQFEDDGVSFVDLGSTNGTLLNGVRLERNKPVSIGPEDEVRIGSMRLHLSRREAATSAPAARPATQFALRAIGPSPDRPAPASPAVPSIPIPDPAPESGAAIEAIEAAAWQLEILGAAAAQARQTFDEALTQAVVGLSGPDRAAARRIAAVRFQAGPGPSVASAAAPGAPARGAPGLEAESLRLLRTFAESYLSGQGAALDSPASLQAFLGAVADVLETAAKSYLELRRGYEEFGREMGIRVASGEGPVTRARDAQALLAWLLHSTEGESRALDLGSGFADLMIHQVALLNGVTEGAKELVSRLSPEAVTARLEPQGGGKLQLVLKQFREGAQWRAYVDTYREVAEEEGALTDALFGKAFARAYSAVAGRRASSSEAAPKGTPRPPRPGRER